MTIRDRRPAPEGITRVEFALTGPEYPFVGASTVGDARVVLEEMIPRGDGVYAEFFSVTGADPDRLLALAEDFDGGEATVLNRYEDGALIEFSVGDGCPGVFLGEEGALPREVYAVDGVGTVAAEIPPEADAAGIVDRFLAAHPDADLARKREQPFVTPMFSQREYLELVDDRLTDRQREILAAAHDHGYYDWPRGITAADLADEVGVSGPTLHKHLRAAEQRVIAALFEPPSRGPESASSELST